MSTLKPGDQFVTRDTYCNEVLKARKTVTHSHIGTVEAMVLHPVYTAIQLEAYIGEPLFREGDIVGTLNFSAFLPKNPEFTPTEIENVRALARQIESALV